ITSQQGRGFDVISLFINNSFKVFWGFHSVLPFSVFADLVSPAVPVYYRSCAPLCQNLKTKCCTLAFLPRLLRTRRYRKSATLYGQNKKRQRPKQFKYSVFPE
ncbi:MAG: hypothetical protein PHE50_09610, partial [Dehalococcoidales bacterium]|nr:hypothetical protein [Dehalococcoidales bacterium]